MVKAVLRQRYIEKYQSIAWCLFRCRKIKTKTMRGMEFMRGAAVKLIKTSDAHMLDVVSLCKQCFSSRFSRIITKIINSLTILFHHEASSISCVVGAYTNCCAPYPPPDR